MYERFCIFGHFISLRISLPLHILGTFHYIHTCLEHYLCLIFLCIFHYLLPSPILLLSHFYLYLVFTFLNSHISSPHYIISNIIFIISSFGISPYDTWHPTRHILRWYLKYIGWTQILGKWLSIMTSQWNSNKKTTLCERYARSNVSFYFI